MILGRFTRLLGCMVCATVAAPCAHAQNDQGNASRYGAAWYLGAGMGHISVDTEHERLVRVDDKSTPFQLVLGKQLSRHFALEAGYYDLGNFSFDAAGNPAGALHSRLGIRGGNVDLLSSLPVAGRLSLQARIGVHYAKRNDYFNGTPLAALNLPDSGGRRLSPKYGVGLEYAFSPGLAMRLDAEHLHLNNAVGWGGAVNRIGVSMVFQLGQARAPAYASSQGPKP